MTNHVRFACMMIATAIGAYTASAQVSLIEVTGVFEATQNADESGLHFFAPLEGQAFTMIFDYDPSVPDSHDSVNVGEYYHSVPPHQFTLTSGSVTLTEPSTYRLYAYQGGGTGTYYSLANHSNVPDVAGLTLPGDTDDLSFGLIHPVSDSVVDFLDNELGDDPLPQDPFFLGVPITGAYVYLNLTTYDADLDEYYDDGIDATVTSISIITALEGDLNGDGFVGLADLDIVLNNWNQNVPPGDPAADPSGDGFVGLDDLDTVLNNWNAGTPPSGQAVPEPASAALLGMGGLVLLRKRS